LHVKHAISAGARISSGGSIANDWLLARQLRWPWHREQAASTPSGSINSSAPVQCDYL
jgi:hypothetical protein